MTKIAIILGSTRPGRFGIQPAEWILKLARESFDGQAEFELVDLQEVNLPFLDEPVPPMMNQYQNDHTKAWAQRIAAFDGFVIVTGEYNHSMPAVLKNALDYLYVEWNHKPVTFVSYGAGAGGLRAVEYLRAIAGQLGMYDLNGEVSFPEYYANLDEQGRYRFSDKQAGLAAEQLRALIFWAERLKAGREALISRA